MQGSAGVVTVVAATIGVLATLRWGLPRLPRPLTDLLLAGAGALVGVGGLLLQTDVGIAAWVLTPVAVATIVVLHMRVLFRGSGPLRT